MELLFDDIDRRILSLLQRNARTPLKHIAQEVFLSSPAVAHRIQRLEQAGIISGYHAQIDPTRLGWQIRAYVTLEVNPQGKKDFYTFIQGVPNVIECSSVTGEYSMIMQGVFQSTLQLDHFVSQLQAFGRTRTFVVFSTPVERRDVPLLAETE